MDAAGEAGRGWLEYFFLSCFLGRPKAYPDYRDDRGRTLRVEEKVTFGTFPKWIVWTLS